MEQEQMIRSDQLKPFHFRFTKKPSNYNKCDMKG